MSNLLYYTAGACRCKTGVPLCGANISCAQLGQCVVTKNTTTHWMLLRQKKHRQNDSFSSQTIVWYGLNYFCQEVKHELG